MTEDEVVEVRARADYRQIYPDGPPWEDASEKRKEAYREGGRGYVSAIRAAGLVVVPHG